MQSMGPSVASSNPDCARVTFGRKALASCPLPKWARRLPKPSEGGPLSIDRRGAAFSRSAGLTSRSRVECVSQCVTNRVEREQRNRHRGGREHEEPPETHHGVNHILPVAQQAAPARLRVIHAKTEEAQEGFIEDD